MYTLRFRCARRSLHQKDTYTIMAQMTANPATNTTAATGHRVFLAMGSNLGDRQANIIEAMQKLRAAVTITKISTAYDTDPVGYSDQPRFLNVVLAGQTALAPRDLLDFVKGIEKKMGRKPSFRNAPRTIDVDILFYDDQSVIEGDDLIVPHPRAAERAFVLVPMSEIAPDFVHPTLNRSIADLLGEVGSVGVVSATRQLSTIFNVDVQDTEPSVHVALTRVGVANIERMIRVGNGKSQFFYAKIDLYANLNPRKAGLHMSRFSEILEEMIGEAAAETVPNLETLADRMAQMVITTQRAEMADARIEAKFPLERIAPVSGRTTQEVYTFVTHAFATKAGVRHTVGVEVEGMTACPCAQDMMRAYSRDILIEQGYSHDEAEKIVHLIPMPTHNQRGKGVLILGATTAINAPDLVEIVEAAMSSENYNLLKRPDEMFIVNKAHRFPRFVEDVVREILGMVVQLYPDLPDDTYVSASQVNFESIHKHDVAAERSGTLGELRREILHDEELAATSDLNEWLRAVLS